MSQKEYWNGEVGQRWAKYQECFDEVFAPLRSEALRRAQVGAGERVVDIGCGAGGTVLEAARKVGPTGHVLGVDVSQPLLDRARERLREARVSAAVELADAGSYAFAGDRDLLFSAFGIMFFEEPEKAFTNLHRALKPTGRATFLCWRPMVESPVMSVPFDAAAPLLPPQEPTPPNAPGPFALGDRARTGRILEGAGFTDVAIEPFDAPIRIGANLEEAVEFTMKLGPTSRAILALDEAGRKPVAEAIRKALGAHTNESGAVVLNAATWIVAAKA